MFYSQCWFAVIVCLLGPGMQLSHNTDETYCQIPVSRAVHQLLYIMGFYFIYFILLGYKTLDFFFQWVDQFSSVFIFLVLRF